MGHNGGCPRWGVTNDEEMSQARRTLREEFKATYRLRLERATVIALLLVITCFHLWPRWQIKTKPLPPIQFQVAVEEVPVTRQPAAMPPPLRPAVPVPVDDPALPLDETIELTELFFDLTPSFFPPGAPEGAQTAVSPPRPVAEVFPEYPKGARQKGAQGVVKVSLLVRADGSVAEAVVILNTTGSEECAQAAIKAARATRFIPAKERGVPVASWTTREYGFYF